MKNFILTQKELTLLRAEHRKVRKYSAKLAYRINAVILLGSGWDLKSVADALLLNKGTLRGYVQKFKTGGIKLLLQTHYSGRQSFLSDAQKLQLNEHLENKLYHTTHGVIHYVSHKYHVKYSQRGMCNLLQGLGFTYKKPKLIPSGFNLQAQEDFVWHFHQFMSQKEDDEVVLFFDSSHPQYRSYTDYGWIKKGKNVLLRNHGMRGRVNISGTVDLETGQVIVNFPKQVNALNTVITLQKIEACYPKANRIHIVLDNASAHKSKLVKGYLKRSKINLVFLPAYSPNLNLMERIWRLMHNKVLSNTFSETFTDFKKKIIRFFKKTLADKNLNWVQPLINGNFQEFEGHLMI